MAHFYARIKGTRGEATRCGDKNNGMIASVDGWNIGVDIEAVHDEKTNCDTIIVTENGGSNHANHQRRQFVISEDKPVNQTR